MFTKTRMEMTNFGCAQLERMAMADIETRYARLQVLIKTEEDRIANAKERMAQYRTEIRKQIKAYNKHAANKADLEAAMD